MAGIFGFLWNGVAYTFQDKRVDSLAKVASSGNYADLSGKPTVDSAMSSTSTNAVQNKAVNSAIAAKQAKHKTATATLAAASWASLSQQVPVTGVTASNSVVISPAPASAEAWGKAGVRATAQDAGKVTFTCKKTPTAALTANIIILD